MGSDKKEKKGGCLSGCLFLAGLTFAVIIIAACVIYFQGGKMANTMLEGVKGNISNLMTEDHTQQEVEQFTRVFSGFVDDLKAQGIKDGMLNNEQLIQRLYEIIEDKRINRAESSEWLKMYAEELDYGERTQKDQ